MGPNSWYFDTAKSKFDKNWAYQSELNNENLCPVLNME